MKFKRSVFFLQMMQLFLSSKNDDTFKDLFANRKTNIETRQYLIGVSNISDFDRGTSSYSSGYEGNTPSALKALRIVNQKMQTISANESLSGINSLPDR